MAKASQEISQLSKNELQNRLQDARGKLRELRFQLAGGKVKNVREIRATRRAIARLLTFSR